MPRLRALVEFKEEVLGLTVQCSDKVPGYPSVLFGVNRKEDAEDGSEHTSAGENKP
jgi:hypothetical protein